MDIGIRNRGRNIEPKHAPLKTTQKHRLRGLKEGGTPSTRRHNH